MSSFSSSQACLHERHLLGPLIAKQGIRDSKKLFLPFLPQGQSLLSLFCIQRWICTKQRQGGSWWMKVQVLIGMLEDTRKRGKAGACSGWVGGKGEAQTLPAPSRSDLTAPTPICSSAVLLGPMETHGTPASFQAGRNINETTTSQKVISKFSNTQPQDRILLDRSYSHASVAKQRPLNTWISHQFLSHYPFNDFECSFKR